MSFFITIFLILKKFLLLEVFSAHKLLERFDCTLKSFSVYYFIVESVRLPSQYYQKKKKRKAITLAKYCQQFVPSADGRCAKTLFCSAYGYPRHKNFSSVKI